MRHSATEYQVRIQMFEALYEDYQKPIERYLVKWIHDQESARDLCQETFAYFWQFLIKETVVQPAANYKTDLYTTAKYRAIDYLRKHNKPIVYLSQSESEENSWFDELRAEGHEELIEDWMSTQDDLLQLPPQQRDSLVQYALGYKQKEIAEKKGISESAVSAYMSLGRNNLRNKKSFAVTADLQYAKELSIVKVSKHAVRFVSGKLTCEVEDYSRGGLELSNNLRNGELFLGYGFQEELPDRWLEEDPDIGAVETKITLFRPLTSNPVVDRKIKQLLQDYIPR